MKTVHAVSQLYGVVQIMAEIWWDYYRLPGSVDPTAVPVYGSIRMGCGTIVAYAAPFVVATRTCELFKMGRGFGLSPSLLDTVWEP